MDLLKETRMLGCNPSYTPMESNYKVGLMIESPPVDKRRYQRLVRKLIYLSQTQPDIGFLVSVISQNMNNPNEEHLEVVYQILLYLKMTPGKGLYLRKGTNEGIEVYSNVDSTRPIQDRRSTTYYYTYAWGNFVTWQSKKQSIVESSVEARFKALVQGIYEEIWLKRLLEELRIEVDRVMSVCCDNLATINIAKNLVHHDRAKHVE